jgi:predicted transcriptional regulator
VGAYDSFRVDKDLERKGVVIDYEKFRVTIARAGGNNKRYEKVLERLSRPYQRAIQTETLDNDKSMDLLKQAYAEAVVLDWETNVDGEWKRGIEDPDTGELLPFNTENVLRVLRHGELHDIWHDLRSQATKAALFRASLEEARAGN